MFKGKTVLITGASSGLGRAMALAFAKQGAVVGMAARRLERLHSLEKEINMLGGKALALQVDVTDEQSLQSGVDTLLEHSGRLDVLINNAGTGIFGRTPSEREYKLIYDTNVHAVYKLSQMALPYLQQTAGNIINIGSSVTERPFAGELVYSATKGAVTALTSAMAATYGKKGVRVNLIQPGVVASEFNVTAGLPPELDDLVYAKSADLNALATTGVPGDVAEAALFLASDRAKFITGEVLKVDGGITLAAIRT
jgi:NAD(P)-dependent dehydrogenase (short-subunit alcohol dehydrogenase family)